jgi:hypothetical protein
VAAESGAGKKKIRLFNGPADQKSLRPSAFEYYRGPVAQV